MATDPTIPPPPASTFTDGAAPVVPASPVTATGALSNLREGAHALIAVLGVLATSGALILGILSAVGVHNVDMQVTEFTGVAGAVAVLLSKLIDSANNAITS